MKLDRAMLSVYLATALYDREPLEAVSIESDGTAVATDGSALVAIEPRDWKADTDEKRFLLRSNSCKDLVKQISKAKSKADIAHVDAEPLDDGKVRVTFKKLDSNGNPMEIEHTLDACPDNFPRWRGALDRRLKLPYTGKVMVNLAYLETMCAVFRQFKEHEEDLYVELQLPGSGGPLLMRAKNKAANRRAIAVVMPVTNNHCAPIEAPLSDWEKACIYEQKDDEPVADAAD